MNAQQRIEHREYYNQLRLAIVFPGDTVGDMRRKYTPVNVDKSDWTFDYALSQPDTAMVAQHRRHEIGMRFMIGAH